MLYNNKNKKVPEYQEPRETLYRALQNHLALGKPSTRTHFPQRILENVRHDAFISQLWSIYGYQVARLYYILNWGPIRLWTECRAHQRRRTREPTKFSAGAPKL